MAELDASATFSSAWELTQAAARRNRSAQRALAEQLLDRVRATVRYLVANDRDADDMVQSCMIEILRSAGSFRGDGRLEGWADRITVRKTLRQIKQRRGRERIVLLGLPSPDRPGYLDAADPHSRRQLERHVASLIARIPRYRRVVLVLRVVHGYSIQEIAEITEAGHNTVRDRLAKAKRQLRRLALRDPVLAEWVEVIRAC